VKFVVFVVNVVHVISKGMFHVLLFFLVGM